MGVTLPALLLLLLLLLLEAAEAEAAAVLPVERCIYVIR